MNNYKFTIILNKKNNLGTVLNATAHMIAALVAKADEATKINMNFMNYIDKDEEIHPVSGNSLIILKADNSNKVRQARLAAIENKLLFTDFVESMTKDSFVEQMERTKQIHEKDLDYWGVAMFGPSDIISQITKKYSLWQ